MRVFTFRFVVFLFLASCLALAGPPALSAEKAPRAGGPVGIAS